jgi:hypothetical protein
MLLLGFPLITKLFVETLVNNGVFLHNGTFVENTRKSCFAFAQNNIYFSGHFVYVIDKANEINLCGAVTLCRQRHIFTYEQILEPHLYSPYLCMCCPTHPLVNKDGVGPHLICHYHSLERVRL